MRVICVDDEPLILEDVTDMLQSLEEVETVQGFSDADALLAAWESMEAPDVAFLDIHMNGMDGVTLARHLKKLAPKLNIIFLTGYSAYMQQALEMHASGYLMKPVSMEALQREMQELRYPVKLPQRQPYARTFGYFDLLVGGVPVHFRREKAKEVLAVLVDARGASLTVEQIACRIFEDRRVEQKLKAQMNTYISCLQNDLKQVGLGDLLIKTWGHLAVDVKKLQSDYFDYLAGKPEALSAFCGEYMTNYSWGEDRIGDFYRDK